MRKTKYEHEGMQAMTNADNDILATKARAFAESKMWAQAEEIYRILHNRDPENNEYLSGLIDASYFAGNYATTDRYLKLRVEREGTYAYFYSKMPLHIRNLDRKTALQESLSRFARRPTPINKEHEGPLIARIFASLLDIHHDNILSLIYENFLANYVFKIQNKNNNLINIFVDKIAIVQIEARQLKWILPIIHAMPNYIYDIVLLRKTENTDTFIKKYELQSCTIKYGIDKIKQYKAIFTDQWLLKYYENDIKSHGAKLMAYTHALDAEFNLNLPHAVFAEYSRQTCALPSRITGFSAMQSELKNANYKDKCEVSVTGPWHLGDLPENLETTRQEQRAMLAQELNIVIPADRPLIVFFEDEISHIGQIYYALNKLSKSCTIIAKFLNGADKQKLNKDIIIYSPLESAPNMLRCSADFIMCGYDSGTFLSSLIVGIPVLPYYSRISKRKYGETKQFIWSNILPNQSWHTNNHGKVTLLSLWTKFFDLLNITKISDAIFGKEYVSWYKNNITSLRKTVFGEYMSQGSAQKTAENIVRFACNGTLGSDCHSVLFK